jgi:hypothetical protein
MKSVVDAEWKTIWASITARQRARRLSAADLEKMLVTCGRSSLLEEAQRTQVELEAGWRKRAYLFVEEGSSARTCSTIRAALETKLGETPIVLASAFRKLAPTDGAGTTPASPTRAARTTPAPARGSSPPRRPSCPSGPAQTSRSNPVAGAPASTGSTAPGRSRRARRGRCSRPVKRVPSATRRRRRSTRACGRRSRACRRSGRNDHEAGERPSTTQRRTSLDKATPEDVLEDHLRWGTLREREEPLEEGPSALRKPCHRGGSFIASSHSVTFSRSRAPPAQPPGVSRRPTKACNWRCRASARPLWSRVLALAVRRRVRSASCGSTIAGSSCRLRRADRLLRWWPPEAV